MVMNPVTTNPMKKMMFAILPLLVLLAGCSREAPPPAATRAPGLKIAMIAKSSTNPVFLSARTGAEAAAQGAVAEARRPDRDRLADAAGRGRPGAGAAHRAGGQRGRERGPDLLLRRRQGDRRDQRRGRARRAGHDLRQRRAGVEALRVLRRRRREDGRDGDGRARHADGRARATSPSSPATRTRRTCASASTASRRRPRSTPASRSSTPSITSRRRRTPPPK